MPFEHLEWVAAFIISARSVFSLALTAFHSPVLTGCGFYSVFCALAAFCMAVVRDRRMKKSSPLHTYLVRAIAGGTVPPAILLMYAAAFDRTILARVPGLEVPILLGGVSLLYLSLQQALKWK